MKKFIFASQVKEGDTLCFGNPKQEIRIERITSSRCNGSIGFHGNNDTWSSFYKPENRVRVLTS